MSSFHRSLSRFHRRWSLGRIVLTVMVLAIVAALGLLAHGWADYKLALSTEARETLNLALISLLALAAVIWLFRIFRTPRDLVAAMIDDRQADPRKRVLAAASLDKQDAETPMQQFHLDRALDDAAGELDKLPGAIRMPFKAMAKAGLGLLLVGGVIAGLQHWATDPFRVVATRILTPSSDTPPYSPLVFEVTPGDLQAVYGGEAVAQVSITGGEVTEDVRCLIRNTHTGEIEEATAYQESAGHYARKFSNTLASLEFAFATGRARSAWHSLDVLLQPKVSSATVTVQPPAYTGRATETFPLESGEIRALEGSTITLNVQSNRPLSGGDLSVKALNDSSNGRPELVSGDSSGAQSVSFSWVAHASSQLSATIKDVRSTPSEKPLELKLSVIPDQAPVVDLTSPQRMVLATPRTKLPFVAEVDDDHGLSKVSMVRALLGYRDRGRMLADAMASRDFNFSESLNLGELGVEAGQVLEFYLEAMDHNPSLLGQGVSDVVRVNIISEDDYAQRLRAKVQLEKFTARYRALAEVLQNARESLKELDEAAEKGDEEAFEKTKEKAEKAHREAQDLADKMAEDFQAFAMEERLAEAAADAANKLSQNGANLKRLDLKKGKEQAREKIDEMLKRLGEVEEKAKELQEDAEEVKKMADLVEMAAEFRRIHHAQQSLVQRFVGIAKEVAGGNTTNAPQLPNLGRLQDLNREALLKFAVKLEKRAEALPPGFEEMQEDVKEFLEKMAELDIPDPMRAAAEAAKKGKSVDAAANANLALLLIERLINEPENQFSEMCQEGGQAPQIPGKPDVGKTMAQLMEALMGRVPKGQGKGKGQNPGDAGGGGGGAGDGFSVAGNSANVPMYGPDRLNFSDSDQAGGSKGRPGKTGQGPLDDQPRNRLNPDSHRETDHAKLHSENVPAKYRSAVKRYFTPDDTPEPTP